MVVLEVGIISQAVGREPWRKGGRQGGQAQWEQMAHLAPLGIKTVAWEQLAVVEGRAALAWAMLAGRSDVGWKMMAVAEGGWEHAGSSAAGGPAILVAGQHQPPVPWSTVRHQGHIVRKSRCCLSFRWQPTPAGLCVGENTHEVHVAHV